MMRVMLSLLATLFVFASPTAVGIASHVAGAHLHLLVGVTVYGYPVDQLIFVTLGISISLLKTGLVFDGVRRRGQTHTVGWLRCGLVLLCCAYTWGVLMWSLATYSPLIAQPILTIILSMWAVAVFESVATALPAIVWAKPVVESQGSKDKPVASTVTKLQAGPKDPIALHAPSSLLGLLTHVAGSAGSSTAPAGIASGVDGSIHTTQGALATALGCSKSTVNRQLQSHQRAGRLRFQTSVRGTRIVLCDTQLNIPVGPRAERGTEGLSH